MIVRGVDFSGTGMRSSRTGVKIHDSKPGPYPQVVLEPTSPFII